MKYQVVYSETQSFTTARGRYQGNTTRRHREVVQADTPAAAVEQIRSMARPRLVKFHGVWKYDKHVSRWLSVPLATIQEGGTS